MFFNKKSTESVTKRKGYWTKEARMDSTLFRCSECRNAYKKSSAICPSCGAVMKKVKYDPIWVDELDILFDDD